MATSWRVQFCWACAWLCANSLACAQAVPIALPAECLENVWRLSERIISGSEPRDAAAFAELSHWGVTTIVSVDGTQPRLELAKKAGMRYVHIPIGYTGVSRESQQMLVRVARDVPGIIYIHCHHGKHRGPAAAAVLCRADDGRSALAARTILVRAGTGREYPGLWRAVERFENPSPSVELPTLVEQAETGSLVTAMTKLDRSFERLKHCASNDWSSARHLDEASCETESVKLMELLAEAARLPVAPALQNKLQQSSALAAELVRTLRAEPKDTARCDELLAKLNSNCTACHQQHRN